MSRTKHGSRKESCPVVMFGHKVVLESCFKKQINKLQMDSNQYQPLALIQQSATKQYSPFQEYPLETGVCSKQTCGNCSNGDKGTHFWIDFIHLVVHAKSSRWFV